MKKFLCSCSYFLVLISLFFILNFKISAANTGTILEGDYINFDGETVTTVTNDNYPTVPYKYTSSAPYLCASGMLVPPPKGYDCTTMSWPTSSNAIGVAYLINSINGAGGTNSYSISSGSSGANKYYWTEVSELYYLGKYDPESSTHMYQNVIHNDSFKLPNGKTFLETQSAAASYENKYSKPIKLSLSTNDLTFKLNEDGYYYSNKVTITDVNNNASVKVTHTNTDSVTLLTDNNTYFQLKIAKSKISGKKISDTVNINGGNEYYTSKIFHCGEGVQNIIPTITYKTSATDANLSVATSLTVTKLTIRKTDSAGKLLPGSKIKVENSDKSYSKTFTTTDEIIVIEDLPLGKYTITEIDSPEGYALTAKPVTITFSSTSLTSTVSIKNYFNTVKITKLSEIDNKLLKGAKLEIQDEKENVLYEWESSDEPFVIEGIKEGTYYLIEKEAPKGYQLNTEKIKFVVDGKTQNIEVKMKNTLEVIVPDTLGSKSVLLVSIGMLDIAVGIGILVYVKKNKIEE